MAERKDRIGFSTIQLNTQRNARYEAIRADAEQKLNEGIKRPALLDKMMAEYEKYLKKVK